MGKPLVKLYRSFVILVMVCSVISKAGDHLCKDLHPWCNVWHKNTAYCHHLPYARTHCMRSCNLCKTPKSQLNRGGGGVAGEGGEEGKFPENQGQEGLDKGIVEGVRNSSYLKNLGQGRVDFFNYKTQLDADHVIFSVQVQHELDELSSDEERSLETCSKYATREGEASEDHMCGTVYNSVPSHLTFITKYNYYQKYTHAYNIPVVSSANVSDAALKRACYVLRFMLADRRILRRFLYKYQGRVGIIGRDEQTTDIPEHSWLPKWWDKRARGLGGTLGIPISTGTEENLLCELATDRYPSQDIFLHETAHGIQEIAVRGGGIPGYYTRLKNAYQNAKNKSLWENTYSMSTVQEYFAEGTQSYFWVNSYAPEADGIRGPIHTRERLKVYDPELYELIREVFPCGNRMLKRCEAISGVEAPPFKMNCDGDGEEVVVTHKDGEVTPTPLPTTITPSKAAPMITRRSSVLGWLTFCILLLYVT